MRCVTRLAADYASQLLLKRGFVVVEDDTLRVLEWLEKNGGGRSKPVEISNALELYFSRARDEQERRNEPDSDEDVVASLVSQSQMLR